LVAGNRDAYLPDLATSLWMTASVCLTVDGPMEHAIASAVEAVGLYEELAAAHPAAFTDRLSAAAETLAKVHDARGESDSAATVRARFGNRATPGPPEPSPGS
jgi:hypothetical protein